MKNTNLPPFYVGQRVVAVVNSVHLVNGNEYVIREITKHGECGCWSVDIGIKRFPVTKACICKHGIRKLGSDWFHTKYFAPIESTFESISFKKVVEIESPLVGIN